MAQHLISVLDETAGTATAEEMAAIDVNNEQLQADGHRVFAGGPRVAQCGHRCGRSQRGSDSQ